MRKSALAVVLVTVVVLLGTARPAAAAPGGGLAQGKLTTRYQSGTIDYRYQLRLTGTVDVGGTRYSGEMALDADFEDAFGTSQYLHAASLAGSNGLGDTISGDCNQPGWTLDRANAASTPADADFTLVCLTTINDGPAAPIGLSVVVTSVNPVGYTGDVAGYFTTESLEGNAGGLPAIHQEGTVDTDQIADESGPLPNGLLRACVTVSALNPEPICIDL